MLGTQRVSAVFIKYEFSPLLPLDHSLTHLSCLQHLQDIDGGPCDGYAMKAKAANCSNVPDLHVETEKHGSGGLSTFAHDWIEYSCCQILSEPMPGFVAAVWLWLQVCTTAMNSATPESYRLDESGSLHDMKRYCPQDLDGGELSEWAVKSFFPV